MCDLTKWNHFKFSDTFDTFQILEIFSLTFFNNFVLKKNIYFTKEKFANLIWPWYTQRGLCFFYLEFHCCFSHIIYLFYSLQFSLFKRKPLTGQKNVRSRKEDSPEKPLQSEGKEKEDLSAEDSKDENQNHTLENSSETNQDRPGQDIPVTNQDRRMKVNTCILL